MVRPLFQVWVLLVVAAVVPAAVRAGAGAELAALLGGTVFAGAERGAVAATVLTGAEAATVTAAVATLETTTVFTGTEAATVAAALVAATVFTGAEAATVAATLVAATVFAGTEAATVTAAVATLEAAALAAVFTGAEAAAVAATLVAATVFAGTEAAAVATLEAAALAAVFTGAEAALALAFAHFAHLAAQATDLLTLRFEQFLQFGQDGHQFVGVDEFLFEFLAFGTVGADAGVGGGFLGVEDGVLIGFAFQLGDQVTQFFWRLLTGAQLVVVGHGFSPLIPAAATCARAFARPGHGLPEAGACAGVPPSVPPVSAGRALRGRSCCGRPAIGAQRRK